MLNKFSTTMSYRQPRPQHRLQACTRLVGENQSMNGISGLQASLLALHLTILLSIAVLQRANGLHPGEVQSEVVDWTATLDPHQDTSKKRALQHSRPPRHPPTNPCHHPHRSVVIILAHPPLLQPRSPAPQIQPLAHGTQVFS